MKERVAIDWVKFRGDVVNERGPSPRAAVADAVGCSETMLKYVEDGKRLPNVELFANLCAWMGRDVSRYVVAVNPAVSCQV